MTHVRRGDRARQLLILAAAIAQTALPVLLPPRFDPDELPPDVLQPAPTTFAVWLPVFATSIAHAGLQAMPGRADEPLLLAVGGPATVAYAATAIWAPLIRARRYWWAQGALFTIAGSAEVGRRRVAAAERHGDVPRGVRLAVAPPLAMLAAWGAAASAVNLGAMLIGSGKVPAGRPARVVGGVLTIATAATALTAATSAPGGAATSAGRIYLSTVAWALGGIIAGQGRRNPTVAASAAASLLPVILSLADGIRTASAAGNKIPGAGAPADARSDE